MRFLTSLISLLLFVICSFFFDTATGLLSRSTLRRHVGAVARFDLRAANSESSNMDDIRKRLKSSFLRKFDGPLREDNIFACPESLKPMQAITRIYGGYTERYFLEPEHGTVYPILPCRYADLTVGASEAKGLFDSVGLKRPGEAFFQNPLISGVYERGYRQNFENFGFPGIEKEFAEASAFFESAGATKVVVDLSCGSGFMTRKFVNSTRCSFRRYRRCRC